MKRSNALNAWIAPSNSRAESQAAHAIGGMVMRRALDTLGTDHPRLYSTLLEMDPDVDGKLTRIYMQHEPFRYKGALAASGEDVRAVAPIKPLTDRLEELEARKQALKNIAYDPATGKSRSFAFVWKFLQSELTAFGFTENDKEILAVSQHAKEDFIPELHTIIHQLSGEIDEDSTPGLWAMQSIFAYIENERDRSISRKEVRGVGRILSAIQSGNLEETKMNQLLSHYFGNDITMERFEHIVSYATRYRIGMIFTDGVRSGNADLIRTAPIARPPKIAELFLQHSQKVAEIIEQYQNFGIPAFGRLDRNIRGGFNMSGEGGSDASEIDIPYETYPKCAILIHALAAKNLVNFDTWSEEYYQVGQIESKRQEEYYTFVINGKRIFVSDSYGRATYIFRESDIQKESFDTMSYNIAHMIEQGYPYYVRKFSLQSSDAWITDIMQRLTGEVELLTRESEVLDYKKKIIETLTTPIVIDGREKSLMELIAEYRNKKDVPRNIRELLPYISKIPEVEKYLLANPVFSVQGQVRRFSLGYISACLGGQRYFMIGGAAAYEYEYFLACVAQDMGKMKHLENAVLNNQNPFRDRTTIERQRADFHHGISTITQEQRATIDTLIQKLEEIQEGKHGSGGAEEGVMIYREMMKVIFGERFKEMFSGATSPIGFISRILHEFPLFQEENFDNACGDYMCWLSQIIKAFRAGATPK